MIAAPSSTCGGLPPFSRGIRESVAGKRPLFVAGVIALLAAARAAVAMDAPEPRQEMRLQAFVESARCYASLPRFAHKPEFSLVRVGEKAYSQTHFWIMDGRQKIGLLNLWIGEVELFRFFPPAGGAPVEYKMPAVHHWATLQGPRITIVPQGTWTNGGEMAYLQDKGEQIRLRYSKNLDGNAQMVHGITLRFDPVLGYILDCVFEMVSDEPQRFEYANLLTGGLAEARDDHKRYQKCLWTRRDGTFCYLYQNPLSLMQRASREWRDMPESGGFFGWVAERDMNPFLEIIRSSPGTTLETCTQWYDQHVLAQAPEQKGDDGRYHITAAYRLLSLPLPVAKELEDAARTMLPAPARSRAVGFRLGIVNDFETFISAGMLYNGCLWDHGARYDSTTGHSGTHSLRLDGGETAQPIHGGPAIVVETAKRYRLSAWVRTRGVTGKGACLRVNEVFWNWNDLRASHYSTSLTGENDWTRLQVEFEPVAGDPFAVPGLVVDGGGIAWFDDIELVEIPR